MGSTNEQVVNRWVDIALDRSEGSQLKAPNIITRGDKIYSFGLHFEMARFVRNKRDKIVRVLLNGDTWPSGWGTTTRHQWLVRDAVSVLDLPTITIPFSVLDAAGIEKDSVEIVHILPDRNEEHCFEQFEQPDGTYWDTCPRYGNVDFTPEELEQQIDEEHKRRVERWQSQVSWASRIFWQEPERAKNIVLNAGSSTPRREDVRLYRTSERRQVGVFMSLAWRDHMSGPFWRHAVDVQALPGGTVRYSWKESRHWLGESLIIGKTREPVIKRCATCGVRRTRVGIGGTMCRSCHDAPVWRARNRWAYYLSAFDRNEPGPSYFFCELPRGVHPETVDEALECLKPETVRLAEAMEREVRRQGDIFAISTNFSKRDLSKQGAVFARMKHVLGTNHAVTESAVLPDGTTLGRGILWHKPGRWRRPDHVRLHLADGWSILVKNLVPVAK